VSAEDPEIVRVHGFRLDIERLSYATVVVMSVLAVYKGWAQLSLLSAALVVIAPVLALAVAHVFAELLQAHAAVQRPLTPAEWRAAVAHQPHLLLAAVPPLVVLTFGRVTPVDVENVRAVVLATGTVTLMGLAAVAGTRAGYRGWRLVGVSLAGGVVGLILICLQVVLKPS